MIKHTHNSMDSAQVDANDVINFYHATDALRTTTDQTVEGVKTFTSIPILPNDPTADNQMVRKAYIDAIEMPTFTVVATEKLQDSADELETTSNTSPFKKKEITYNGPDGSTIRTKFYLQSENGDANARAQVYVNDIAVGTARATVTTGSDPELDWEKYSEDIEVDNGDKVQLYLWADSGDTAFCKNFRLYYNTTITSITAGTVNLD
jgi:hypothetical protein